MITTVPARPAAATVKPAAPPAPAAPPPPMLPDANYWKQALDMATSALQGAQAPILSAQKASDAYYTQRSIDAQNAADAAAALMRQYAPDVQAVYTQASQNQDLIGHAEGAALKDAASGNNAGLNSLLARIGSPGRVDTQAGAAGGALSTFGGTVPAEDFNAQGAAMGAYYAQLPAFEIARGTQNAQAESASGAAEHNTFDAKIMDLASKLPGDTETNFFKLKDAARSDINTRLAIDRLDYDKLKTAWDQNFRVNQANVSIKEFNARQALGVMRMNQSAAQFAQRQMNSDRSYQIALANLGIRKRSAQISAAAAAFKYANGGLSPNEVNTADATLQKLVGGVVQQPDAGGINRYYAPFPTGPKAPRPPATAVRINGAPYVPITYAHWIANAVTQKVPVQMAIERANQLFPPQARDEAALGPLLGLSQKAAAAAAQYAQAQSGMNQINTGPASSATLPTSLATTSGAKAQYQQYAFSRLSRYGWGQKEAPALQRLWEGESGWNPGATNQSSGAGGIPQALGHVLPPDFATNPQVQIDWGMTYIKGRYGTPTRALQFWNATVGRNPNLAPPDLRKTAAYWISRGWGGY